MPSSLDYAVGGAVQAGQFYIERPADEQLLTLCRSGVFAYVLASRQVGKTSLMVHTKEKLASEGIRSAIVDLQVSATNRAPSSGGPENDRSVTGESQVTEQGEAEQWYLDVLTQIVGDLHIEVELPVWWQQHLHLSPTFRMTQFFREIVLTGISSPVVIFVDEIDSLIRLRLSDDFFAAIRYLYNARGHIPEFRRLTFVLIGVARPNDLIRDPERTPFNIGQRVDLTDFTEEEMVPLGDGLDLPADEAQRVIRWVRDWTGGHPFLTQRLCQALARQKQAQWSKAQVDAVVRNVFLGKPGDDHNLRFVQDMLTRRAPNPGLALTSYEQILRGRPPVYDDDKSTTKSHLKLAGVVRRNDDGLLILRNRIYAEIFNQAWVEKQLRNLNLLTELDEGKCPYQGLEAFQFEDQQFFFGRQQMVEDLAGRLETQNLLAIVGPVGSGKSSLVLAGLIPALRNRDGSRDWCYYPPVAPGSDPLTSLARVLQPPDVVPTEWIPGQVECLRRDAGCLARLVGEQCKGTATFVVDRFEEIFTLCADDAVRQAFVENLAGLIQGSAARRVVILTMRSDFETFLGQYSGFAAAFAQARFQVMPPGASELREAIEKPAELVGLKFEDGVADALISDIVGEPAALPLLQFALLKLWESREHNRITWEAYQRLGGVRRALARSADEFFEGLIVEEQITAKRLLLRLVRPGGGREFTSYRVRRGALYRANEAPEQVDRVLDKLVASRLVRIIPGESPVDDQVEIAHDALVRNWPRMVDWCEEERERIGERFELTKAAEGWARLGKDPGSLLRGVLLDRVRSYEDLNELETEFLQASLALREQEAKKEEAQRQTLAAAARRQRRVIQILAVAIVVALVFAAVAVIFGLRVSRELRRSEARSLAWTAGRLLETDATLATLLAWWGVETTAGREGRGAMVEAEAALQQSVQALRLRQTFTGHSAPVRAVAFSPDGEYLATASTDTTVRVWSVVTGTQTALLAGHTDWVNAVTFSPDGKRLVTASSDKTARIWDAASGQLEKTLTGHTEAVLSVVFDADGRLVTYGKDGTTRLWDLETGEQLKSFTGHDGATLGSFSPDGKHLVTREISRPVTGTITIWDVATAQQEVSLAGIMEQVNCVAFSADGLSLAFAGDDRTVRLLDLTSLEEQLTLGELTLSGFTAPVLSLSFSPDSKYLATADQDGMLKVWRVESGTLLTTFSGHTGAALSVAYSPDGEWIASGGEDWDARIWYAKPVQPVLTLAGHTELVNSVAFSPDHTRLVTVGGDGKVIVWDGSSGEQLNSFAGHGGDPVYGAAFSPNGTELATAGADGTARLWNLDSGQERQVFKGHVGAVYAVAFSGDGARLATGGRDGTVRAWDPKTGAQLWVGMGHTGDVWNVSFTQDGSRLASAGGDGTARTWDAASGQSLLILGGHQDTGPQDVSRQDVVYGVAFSSDGKRLATASADGTVSQWDTVSGDRLDRPQLDLRGREAGVVYSVAFSDPEGKRLVTASQDGLVRVWETDSGRELFRLEGHSAAVRDLDISADGTRLATAGLDRTSRVYVLDTAELMNLATRRVPRWFTPEECRGYLHQGQCPAWPRSGK